jgi:hypothetical protein
MEIWNIWATSLLFPGPDSPPYVHTYPPIPIPLADQLPQAATEASTLYSAIPMAAAIPAATHPNLGGSHQIRSLDSLPSLPLVQTRQWSTPALPLCRWRWRRRRA